MLQGIAQLIYYSLGDLLSEECKVFPENQVTGMVVQST